MNVLLRITLILFFVMSCRSEEKQILRIATAANMQFAMEKLCKQFEAETGIRPELILSSSGKLTAQIRNGAPFDLFVSADMSYPQTLFEEGFATAAPQVYGLGKLVLWSYNENLQPSIEILSTDSLKHLAIANPKTAPYGTAALEVIRHYNLGELLQDKLVYGESIAQTNQFVVSGAAELGFTSMSVVLSPQMKGKGKWIEIPSHLHTPIKQGIVILKPGDEAQIFYDFIFSASARSILQEFGYSVSE